MRQLSASLSALVLCAVSLQPVLAAGDPVEELRRAISVRREDTTGKTLDLIAKYRQATLQELIDKLRTIGDLRRALTLREWRDDPALDVKLQDQNAAMRAQIGRRLESALKTVADKPGPENATSRLAVANLIAELGPEVADLNEKDRAGFARTLTPILVKLADDPDLGVKQEALRALGTINAVPSQAAAIYRKVLGDKSEAAGPRRIAADGLGQLMRVILTLEKRTGGVVIIAPAQKLETIKEIAASIPAALSDPDPQVRALALGALQLAAQALGEMVDRQRLQAKAFPPPSRPLSAEETKFILEQQEIIRKEIMDLEAELSALDKLGPALKSVAGDTEPRVQLAALQALESIGYTRLRLRHLAYKVPAIQDNRAVLLVPDSLRKTLDATDPLGSFLKSGGLAQISGMLSRLASRDAGFYTDHAVKARRAAMDFLATLEADATPALDEIVRALNDADRFVRWSAVMVLENIPVEKRGAAVPGLTQLLGDTDLNVRLEAIKALSALGPNATSARIALVQAIDHGDVESRVQAMRAAETVGGAAETEPFIRALTSALSHNDARMRRSAAEILGRQGPAARPAVPALRRLLGDEDDEVRARANEALLSILEGDVK